jgi:flagellar export protein FliJ
VSFVFRLGSVLRHRRRVEDVRALALALARTHEARAAQALGAAQEGARAAQGALGDAAFIGTTGAALGELARGVEDGRRRAEAAARDLAVTEARSEATRVELVEAARARRTLERLEEVQRAAHRREVDVREQRMVDEVAAIAHRGHAVEEEASS